MTCCPHCGYDAPPHTVKRGHLSATTNPARIYWRGERVAMGATTVRVLIPLIRSGEASRDRMAMALSEDAGDETVRHHICRARRAFRESGVPVTIKAESGWGYKMSVEEDG